MTVRSHAETPKRRNAETQNCFVFCHFGNFVGLRHSSGGAVTALSLLRLFGIEALEWCVRTVLDVHIIVGVYV